MAEHSRYSVSAKESGVVRGVLKNKLGIKVQASLDDAETLLLSDTYKYFFDRLEEEGLHFDLPLLFEIHKYFLGSLYEWAGKVRRVNIAKDDILFAPIEHIGTSLREFGYVLKKSIPMQKDSKKVLAQKLAVVHNELNALHPFREGNGRTTRLFLDLIAVSVGYDPINWGKSSTTTYTEACKQGMVLEHRMMEKVIYAGLRKRGIV